MSGPVTPGGSEIPPVRSSSIWLPAFFAHSNSFAWHFSFSISAVLGSLQESALHCRASSMQMASLFSPPTRKSIDLSRAKFNPRWAASRIRSRNLCREALSSPSGSSPRTSNLLTGSDEVYPYTFDPPACPIGSAEMYLPTDGSYVLNRLSRDRPDDSSPLASRFSQCVSALSNGLSLAQPVLPGFLPRREFRLSSEAAQGDGAAGGS
jgi:hypothetical protein